VTQDDPQPDDAWRALDAPFRHRAEWHPIAGKRNPVVARQR
jgi:hypothetical protein